MRSLPSSIVLACCGVTGILPVSAASAQSAVPAWTAGAGAVHEIYRFGDPEAAGIEQVSLTTLPFAVRTPLSHGVRLELSGAFARAALTRADGSRSTLSGLTDTELRVLLPIARDQVTLGAVLVLPTGSATQSGEEAEVASVVASDLLPFRISNWGSGGGAGVNLAVARPVGYFGVGLNAGYRATREFEPLRDDELTYRPGNEAYLRLAVDRSFGRARKATLQVSAQRFADDELDGRNLYRAGNRYQVIGSYAFPGGSRSGAVVYGGVLRRENGTSLDGLQRYPSQNLLLLGGGMRMPLGRGALLPSVDARVFRSSDGVGQGYVAGAGGSAEWPLGSATLVPSARLRLGRVLVADDVETGLAGVDLGFTIRFGESRR
ncbi:MAG TPA: hypothetical protein VHG28_01730 [Longimicrobiaceae bacterium]|nr:hypothetical protein [Longimicrobiaceae bacterium]